MLQYKQKQLAAMTARSQVAERMSTWEEIYKWFVLLHRTDLRRIYLIDHTSWQSLHPAVGRKEILADVELVFFTETGIETKISTSKHSEVYEFPSGLCSMMMSFVLSSIMERTTSSVSVYVLSNEREFSELVKQILRVHPSRNIHYRNVSNFNIDTITSPLAIAEPVIAKNEENAFLMDHRFILESLEPKTYTVEELVQSIKGINGYEEMPSSQVYRIVDRLLEKKLASMVNSSIVITKEAASSPNKRHLESDDIEGNSRKVHLNTLSYMYTPAPVATRTATSIAAAPSTKRERRALSSDPQSFSSRFGVVDVATSIPVLNMLIQTCPNAPRAPFASTFVDRRSGPDHCPTFESSFHLSMFPELEGVVFTGAAATKKESQKKAAFLACIDLLGLGIL